MAETFFFSLKTATWCCQCQPTNGSRGLGAGEPGHPGTVTFPAAGKFWRRTLEMQEQGCVHTSCLLPSAVMLHEAERHSQSLGAGLPLHKENCEIVGEPPLPDLPNRATPNLPGLSPQCWPLWPPCPMASPLRRAELGSKAPPENRSRAGPFETLEENKPVPHHLQTDWQA